MIVSLEIRRGEESHTVNSLPVDVIEWEAFTGKTYRELSNYSLTDLWLIAYFAENRDVAGAPSFVEWRRGVSEVVVVDTPAADPTQPNH